jgi:tight adherence protein C
MISLLAGLIVSLLILLLGPLLLIYSVGWFRTDPITNRIQEYSGQRDGMRRRMSTDLHTRRIGLTGSFIQRVITPFIRRVARLLGRLTPVQALAEQEHRLILAGQPLGLGAREFFGIRIVYLLFGVFFSYLLLRQGYNLRILILIIQNILFFILFPIVWLRQLIRRQQRLIAKSLPDALDMLSVCASAGLGFDQSLQRVSQFWESAVGYEFGRVIAEMEMGLSRQEALRNMRNRTDVDELSSFVSLIIQAEKLGMSISDTITAMAEQMRIERRFRAQEEARKLPMKIMFPLVFFIFPAMLAVILGPSLPALVELFQLVGAG